MGFSNKDKGKILFYLGYSGLTLTEGSTHYSQIIADRLETLSESPEISRIIKRDLRVLESLDENIEKAKIRLSASQVDSITLNDQELRMLRRERKIHIKEMAKFIDLPVYSSRSGNIGVSI